MRAGLEEEPAMLLRQSAIEETLVNYAEMREYARGRRAQITQAACSRALSL